MPTFTNMQAEQNVSLQPYNTFGLDVTATNFLRLTEKELLHTIAEEYNGEKHIIGGGSNILLTKDVNGLTILNCLKGIEILKTEEPDCYIRVASGEVWHEFVLYAIEKGLGGIENLALIPGTVGAAPMQNIGAYGVEVKEVIQEVTAWHWEKKEYVTYTNQECNFGYRDSIFKHELKGKVFITDVVFKLSTEHVYHTEYGAIKTELEHQGVTNLSIAAIADAVIAIRSSKLPNPKEIGNAGSFFKNPTISTDTFLKLKDEHKDMPSYTVDENTVKVPAGWLIEQCGLKGIKKGATGIHSKQALVIVNHGGAHGKDIWALSEEVLQSVESKFGILLEREVQVW